MYVISWRSNYEKCISDVQTSGCIYSGSSVRCAVYLNSERTYEDKKPVEIKFPKLLSKTSKIKIFFVIDAYYLFINIKQLDALNFIISLFQSPTCFEHMCSSSGGQKLYYTVSGIITPIGGCPVHRLREDWMESVHGTATYRCDDTRGCIVHFCPPDDEHMCSKHVEAWNKHIIKFSASSWLILR